MFRLYLLSDCCGERATFFDGGSDAPAIIMPVEGHHGCTSLQSLLEWFRDVNEHECIDQA
ncbi:hypothetical protein BT96DRAFT_701845 [Gymnopus androsaceus JB14]|uniref:Uncharacterized protein n=1 Tax=Gymnopus androsaceus JB14 TaxID=1447944 RepID=A0A6A4HQ84_9AGAR|nr:hypothetical protein BT96DRAFT_701845 [Gymnopus androsaceus JB14]